MANAGISGFFAISILLLVATSLGQTFFSAANLQGVFGIPGWVVVITPIIIGMGFLLILWKSASSGFSVGK